MQGIERIRISSIEPNLLTDEIIEFVTHSKRFVPHFHIPLQSGSDKILKSMRRRYLRELYEKELLKLKAVCHMAALALMSLLGFR